MHRIAITGSYSDLKNIPQLVNAADYAQDKQSNEARYASKDEMNATILSATRNLKEELVAHSENTYSKNQQWGNSP